MMAIRITLTALAATALTLTTTAAANPAPAATPVVVETLFSAGDFRQLTPDELATRPAIKERVRAYVARAAQETRRMLSEDSAKVLYAERGNAHIMTVTTGPAVARAGVATVSDSKGTTYLGAVELEPDTTPAPHTRDAGSPSGATRVGSNCRDIWFGTDKETDDDNHVFDCYEKFRGDKVRNEYVYNRYSTFTAAKPLWLNKHEILDATIRFRPWKSKNNVRTGPLRTVPVPSENCSQQSFSIGVSAGSVSFPMMLCSTRVTVINKNENHSTAVIWEGITSAQVRLDGASMYLTTGSELVNSDYVYMKTRSCFDTPGPCVGGIVPPGLWTDGGWS